MLHLFINDKGVSSPLFNSRSDDDLYWELETVLTFAPKVIFRLYDYMDETEDFSPKYRKAIIYGKLQESLRAKTICDLAKICIEICKDYLYPDYNDLEEFYRDLSNSKTYDESKRLLNIATNDLTTFLLLQYEYWLSYNADSLPIKRIFSLHTRFSNVESEILADKIYSRFSSAKAEAMKHDDFRFSFLNNQDYIYYSLAEEKEPITISSKIKLHSIYDFFMLKALAFNPMKFNPYGIIYDIQKISSIKMNTVKHFTNSFFQKGVHLDKFNISPFVFNYLVERFSNANLINKIFSSWEKHGYGPGHANYTEDFTNLIIAFTNYPLVDKRLELVDVYLDNFPAFHRFSLYFSIFLLYQTFFYFPLLSNIFRVFINFRGKSSNDMDIHSLPIIRNQDKAIPQLFSEFGNNPYFPFPSISNTIAPNFYDEISILTYVFFDYTIMRLRNYEFITANYESQLICDNGTAISLNIAKELLREIPSYVLQFCN